MSGKEQMQGRYWPTPKLYKDLNKPMPTWLRDWYRERGWIK